MPAPKQPRAPAKPVRRAPVLTETFVPYESLTPHERTLVDNTRELLGGEAKRDVVIMGLIANNWDVNKYVEDTLELLMKKPSYNKTQDLVLVDEGPEKRDGNNSYGPRDGQKGKGKNRKQQQQRQQNVQPQEELKELERLKKTLTRNEEVPVIQMNNKKYGWGKDKPVEANKEAEKKDKVPTQKQEKTNPKNTIPKKQSPSSESKNTNNNSNNNNNNNSKNVAPTKEKNTPSSTQPQTQKKKEQEIKETVQTPQQQAPSTTTTEAPKKPSVENVKPGKVEPVKPVDDKNDHKSVTTETEKELKPIQKTRSQQTTQNGKTNTRKPSELLKISIGYLNEKEEQSYWENAKGYSFGIFELLKSKPVVKEEAEKDKKANNDNKSQQQQQQPQQQKPKQKEEKENVEKTKKEEQPIHRRAEQHVRQQQPQQQQQQQQQQTKRNVENTNTKMNMNSNQPSYPTEQLPPIIATQPNGYGMLYQPLAFFNPTPQSGNMYTNPRASSQFAPQQAQSQAQVMFPGAQLPRGLNAGPAGANPKTAGNGLKDQVVQGLPGGPGNMMFSPYGPQQGQFPFIVNAFPGANSAPGQQTPGQYVLSPYVLLPPAPSSVSGAGAGLQPFGRRD